MAEYVIVIMELRGAREFKAAAMSTSTAVSEMDTRTNKLSGSMEKTNKHVGLFRRGLSGMKGWLGNIAGNIWSMAKGAGALAAGFIAWRGVNDAISQTTQLAKGTKILNYYMGEGVTQASRWAGMLQVRGIDAKTFVMSLRSLSTQLQGAQKGSKTALPIFDRLGLRWQKLAKEAPSQRILDVVEAFKTHDKGVSRAVDMQRILGRGAAALAPMFSKGSKGIQEQLDLMDKYGVTLHGKTIKSLSDLLTAQKEQKAAMMGLQLAIGQALIPYLTRAITWFNRFVNQMRTGTGTGGRVRRIVLQMVDALKQLWHIVQPIFNFLSRHPKLTTYLVVGGFLASRILKIAGGVSKLAGALRELNSAQAAGSMFGGGRTGVGPSGWAGKAGTVARYAGPAAIGAAAGVYLSNKYNVWGGSSKTAADVTRGANPFPVGTSTWDAWNTGYHGQKQSALKHVAWNAAMQRAWRQGKKASGRRAGGGPVGAGGAFLVGERGPEILTMGRTGGTVSSNRDVIAAIRSLAGQPIVVQTTMDGRVVTQGVARRVADAKARR